MPVSFKENLVFIHIPKTGGTHVESLLDMKESQPLWGYCHRKKYYKQHFTQNDVLDTYPRLAGYTFFTIVRNPYTRLASVYNQKNSPTSDPWLIDFIGNDTFVDFLDKVRQVVLEGNYKGDNSSIHFKPMVDFFNAGNCEVVKYEEMHSVLKQKFNIETSSSHKISCYNNLYRSNPGAKELIEVIYKKDLDTFGYKFPYTGESALNIAIIGPGIMPIPPKGWGAVEILIWDTKCTLEDLGHTVHIVNTPDRNQIVRQIQEINPDFVHIHYDDFVDVAPQIKKMGFPCAITSHFGYLEQPMKYGSYGIIMKNFIELKPNIFCLSSGIAKTYTERFGIPKSLTHITPNGVQRKLFSYTTHPTYPNRSIYLAKIDDRKRQHIFQSIEGLYFAGNIADSRFDTASPRYLGMWTKEVLYKNLTNYGNLVLLSDGEAHPLVCMEALSAGLGLVVSEFATANLDTSLPFITVVPEKKIHDLKFVEDSIRQNRETSVRQRARIIEYARSFDWKNVISNYYLPSVWECVRHNAEKK